MPKPRTLNVAVTNRDALLEVTSSLTGKWTHSTDQVADLADVAERRLDRICMPKGKRKGVIATHTIKGPAARAYGFAVNGSIVTLRRSNTGWRVIGFEPKHVFPQQGGRLRLQISPEQDAAAAAAMRDYYDIVVRTVEIPLPLVTPPTLSSGLPMPH